MKFLKSMLLVFILIMMPLAVMGQTVHGTMPGGEPSLSFEDGGLDFFVLFNSLLDDTITLHGETASNPQGDTCLPSSPFTLTSAHVPNDAIVESAYLVWMGAVAPDKLTEPTDNEVTLSFDNENTAHPVTHTTSVKSGDVGKVLTDAGSLEFEGIKFEDDVEIGCSETSDGSTVKADIGYFSYRVEVTEFMKEVQKKGVDAAVVVGGEGDAIYGKYTVSDLTCTDHDNYKCRTTMVSAWSLIVIYRSGKIRSKKIYFYNGLSYVQGAVSKAEVSGFVLPKNPIVRQTLMVAEGDPALDVSAIMPKEELRLQGENATAPYRLYNKCNPKTGLDYEIYNSNSSIINWDPDAAEEDLVTCVTGGVDDQKYGLDVDTFLLDAERNINLMEHLTQGNTKMDITLSVNQDAIITNFMMLSVDTKSPAWDVPPEAKNLPFSDDREKQFCACSNPSTDNAEYYCYGERPFYYMIKVENWGTNIAEDVWVSDELKNMDYIPGTAEIATQYNAAKEFYTDWLPIQDKSGSTATEKFPLSGKGYKVADTMDTCDINTWTCKDTRLIRFLVKPQSGLPKQAVLKNTAVITDSSGTGYKTNNAWPIPIAGADCVGMESCAQPRPEDCGGIKVGCLSDDDCDPGMTCNTVTEECEYNADDVCTSSIVKFNVGPNSPSDSSDHIIYRDNGGNFLVVGQLQLNASTCSESKNFFFTALFATFTKEDNLIEFPEQQLVYDADSDGVYTQGVDKVVSSVILKETTGFRILLNEKEQAYSGSTNHNFLIMTKVNYPEGQKVGRTSKFHFFIDSSSSLHGEDGSGDVSFEGMEATFATFMLEPEGNYFLATLGEKDASVPQTDKGWAGNANKEIPVMQIWTKSSEVANEVTEIRVRMAPGSNMRFGDDISSVSLYQDMDGNGTGDVLLQRRTTFEATGPVFRDFDLPLTYSATDTKTFIITADLSGIEEGQKALFLIADRAVALKSSTTTVGLPINSKTFQCVAADGETAGTCPSENNGGGGGKCTITSVDSNVSMQVFLLFVALFSGLFFVSRKRSSRK